MAKTKDRRPKLTSHPVVAKEWRPLIEALRAEGCMFLPAAHGSVVVYKDGQRLPITVGSRSRSSGSVSAAVAKLRRQGLLADYGKPPAKKPEQPRPVAVAPPTPAPRPVPPEPVPVTAPALKDPEEEHEVSAITNDHKPKPSPRPARAHTGHQARLDDIRRRVFTCLRELGGNHSINRAELTRLAIAEARTRELRLPRVPKTASEDEAQERIYASLMQSLRKFLAGGGQTDWVLDIWEAAVSELERPRPQAERDVDRLTKTDTLEEVARATLGVLPDHIRERAEERLLARATPASSPEKVLPHAVDEADEEWQRARREEYLSGLTAKAIEGDLDARDRVEWLLWGGSRAVTKSPHS